MTETYIILREVTPSTGSPSFGTLGTLGTEAAGPANAGVRFTTDLEELSHADLAQAVAQKNVRGAAPSMPIKLIMPVEADQPSTVRPASTNVSWGVTAVGADTSRFDGTGVVVAVLDTGIDRTHPAFASLGDALVEKDFTGEGNGDTNGHGTHCAGTIFGADVDGMRIGIARGVKKALVGKVIGESGGLSGNIVKAIEWAQDEGANVISMSLGMDFPGYVAALTAQGIQQNAAVSKALEGYRANVSLFERLASLVRSKSNITQPTVIIAAAGNESKKPNYDMAVAPPAVSEGFISVAAVGQDTAGLKIAPFSNVGANIAAPGVDIISAKMGGGLTSKSGTSMATPHVTGVAALFMQKLVASGLTATASQLSAMVLASAGTQSLAPAFNPLDIGSGLIRAPQN